MRLRDYRLAYAAIEKQGAGDDIVLELSQPTAMGGVTLTVTPKSELRADYIGYRGFMAKAKLAERIAQLERTLASELDFVRTARIQLGGEDEIPLPSCRLFCQSRIVDGERSYYLTRDVADRAIAAIEALLHP